MMMMGEGAHAPPWQHAPAGGGAEGEEASQYSLLAALRRYLPSNEAAAAGFEEEDDEEAAAAVDAYACDEFRMYEFKVRRCARGRSHDWTDCPFAHPGEKARRRDPRRYHYSGTACPDFRKGGCKRGDACEFAHGVFECWLHPARYRTQPCKDGTACRRRVCFFAHTPDQLRVLPPHQHQSHGHSPRGAAAASSPLAESYDGSPLRRQAFESYLTKSIMSSSPTSTLVSPPRSPPSESPPLSPDAADALRRGSWPGVGSPVSDVLSSLRQLRLSSSPSGASYLAGYPSGAFGSPKSPGIYSLPSTPTRASPVTVTTASGATVTVERLNLGLIEEAEEQPMERVESGRALREKVFERLSKEATVPNDTNAAATAAPAAAPDVGWVSDLIN
ncbi:hypothetical protein ACP70R_040774 [Stipagrostis hirtigluma subsp. patula]